MFDLPPAIAAGEIPQQCVVATIQRYQIPATLIVGILGQENGRVGTASRNSNGSVDYGPGQVNSIWLATLAPYGVTAKDLQWDGCKNLWVSGWIMRRCLNKFNNFVNFRGFPHLPSEDWIMAPQAGSRRG